MADKVTPAVAVRGDAEALRERPTIEDGFGNVWSQECPSCHQLTMEVVRPGKVQCGVSCKPITRPDVREGVQAVINSWKDDEHEYAKRMIIMQLEALLSSSVSGTGEAQEGK